MSCVPRAHGTPERNRFALAEGSNYYGWSRDCTERQSAQENYQRWSRRLDDRDDDWPCKDDACNEHLDEFAIFYQSYQEAHYRRYRNRNSPVAYREFSFSHRSQEFYKSRGSAETDIKIRSRRSKSQGPYPRSKGSLSFSPGLSKRLRFSERESFKETAPASLDATTNQVHRTTYRSEENLSGLCSVTIDRSDTLEDASRLFTRRGQGDRTRSKSLEASGDPRYRDEELFHRRPTIWSEADNVKVKREVTESPQTTDISCDIMESPRNPSMSCPINAATFFGREKSRTPNRDADPEIKEEATNDPPRRSSASERRESSQGRESLLRSEKQTEETPRNSSSKKANKREQRDRTPVTVDRPFQPKNFVKQTKTPVCMTTEDIHRKARRSSPNKGDIKPKALIKPGLRSGKKDSKKGLKIHTPSKNHPTSEPNRKLVQKTLDSFFSPSKEVRPTSVPCAVSQSHSDAAKSRHKKRSKDRHKDRSHRRGTSHKDGKHPIVRLTLLKEDQLWKITSNSASEADEPSRERSRTVRLAEVAPIPRPAKKRSGDTLDCSPPAKASRTEDLLKAVKDSHPSVYLESKSSGRFDSFDSPSSKDPKTRTSISSPSRRGSSDSSSSKDLKTKMSDRSSAGRDSSDSRSSKDHKAKISSSSHRRDSSDSRSSKNHKAKISSSSHRRDSSDSRSSKDRKLKLDSLSSEKSKTKISISSLPKRDSSVLRSPADLKVKTSGRSHSRHDSPDFRLSKDLKANISNKYPTKRERFDSGSSKIKTKISDRSSRRNSPDSRSSKKSPYKKDCSRSSKDLKISKRKSCDSRSSNESTIKDAVRSSPKKEVSDSVKDLEISVAASLSRRESTNSSSAKGIKIKISFLSPAGDNCESPDFQADRSSPKRENSEIKTSESSPCKSSSDKIEVLPKKRGFTSENSPTKAVVSKEAALDETLAEPSPLKRVLRDSSNIVPRSPMKEVAVERTPSKGVLLDSSSMVPRSPMKEVAVEHTPSKGVQRASSSMVPRSPMKEVAVEHTPSKRVLRDTSNIVASSPAKPRSPRKEVGSLQDEYAQAERDEAARKAEAVKAAQRNKKRHTRGNKVFVHCDVLDESIERHPVQNEIPVEKWNKWLNPSQLRCLTLAMLGNEDLCLNFTAEGDRNEDWEAAWVRLSRRLNTVCHSTLTNLNTGLRMTVAEWKKLWLEMKATIRRRTEAMKPEERVHSLGSLECLLFNPDLYKALMESNGKCLGEECPRIWCSGACLGVLPSAEPIPRRPTEL